MLGMPTCEEVARSATDYLEKALPLRRSLALRMHLLMCRHCKAFVNSLRCVAGLGPLLRDVENGTGAEAAADRLLDGRPHQEEEGGER